MPYIEQDAVWRQAIEAAKAQPYPFSQLPHPFTTIIPIYGCPADWRVRQTVLARGRLPVALGSYLGVAGTRHSRRDGLLFRDSRVKFTGITDGTSNTLLLGERPPPDNMLYGWWYGGIGQDGEGSVEVVLGTRELNHSSLGLGGCPYGPHPYQPGEMKNLCSRFHFWSHHPGGANFALADGSVRFLRYTAADIMPVLATRAGGEVVALPD